MRYYSLLLTLCIVGLVGCKRSLRFTPHNPLEANRLGTRILSTALEKHNDFYKDSTAISFNISTDDYYHPTQSQVPFHPMVTGYRNLKIWISPQKGMEIYDTEMKAGSYVFHDVIVLKNKQGFSYNVNTKTYEENSHEFVRNHDLLPQTYLRKALENRAGIKIISKNEAKQDSTLVVESFFDDAQHTFWLDQDTTLMQVEKIVNSSTYGQGLRTCTFKNNQRINGYLLPSEIVQTYKNEVWDEVVNTYRLKPMEEKKITQFLDGISNYTPGDHSYRKQAEVTKLSDRLYILENVTSSSRFWSYNILFAEFDNFIMVTEAAVNNSISALVMEKIRETIPDKPIKFIVQSHHHSDHIAGIKKYIEEGVTIISSPSTAKVIEKIGKAYSYESGEEHLQPEFKIVNDSLKFADDSLSAIILELGPTLHSQEMVAIYFPKEGIMYQADLVNYGEWPVNNAISLEFAKRLRELAFPINKIIGLHGKRMDKKEVERFLSGKLENTYGANDP